MSKIADSLTSRSEWLADSYYRKRYAILFYLLLLTFIISPLRSTLRLRANITELLLAVTLLVAVFPVRAASLRRTLFGLIALAVFAKYYFATPLNPTFSSINMGIWTIVGLLAAANALRFTLRATSIDSAHIYAALSAYLLAGLSFGILYWAIEHTWPGSILYSGAGLDRFSEANGIYFSFVTLATLGYGDFVPKTDIARGLAILEAVAGQLYLGVMVARLVSLYVSASAGKKEQ